MSVGPLSVRSVFSKYDLRYSIASTRNDLHGLSGKLFRADDERWAFFVFRPRQARRFLQAPRVFAVALLCLLLFGERVQMALRFFSATSNVARLLALLDVVYKDLQDLLGRFFVGVDAFLKYVYKVGIDYRHF